MTNATDTAGRSALPWWALLLALLLVLPGLVATSSTAYAEDEEPAEEAEEMDEDEAEEPAEEPVEEPKAELPWVKDVAAAKKQAADEGKDLFINFTGSDWCGWCHKLDDEVFTHAAFVDEATKKFVFVFLDFPRDEALKAKVVDPELNEKLQDHYLVAGFPTIILATAEGKPYGRAGYNPGGPEAYLELLAEKQEGGEVVKKLLADEKHEDVEALKAAFPVIAENSFLAFPDYAWTLEAVEKLDPNGDLELKHFVDQERQRQLANAEQEELQKLFPQSREEEPDRDAIIAFLVKSEHLNGPQFLNMCFGLSSWLLEQDRPEDAKALIARAAQDPLAQEHPQAKDIVEKLTARADEMIAGPAEDGEEDPGDEDGEEDHDEDDEGHDEDGDK